MITRISVPDMMCENCVKRITNALTAEELTFQVSLSEKSVTIAGASPAQAAFLKALAGLWGLEAKGGE